jgi:hypothetical protein
MSTFASAKEKVSIVDFDVTPAIQQALRLLFCTRAGEAIAFAAEPQGVAIYAI